eukprot:582900_1
MLQHQLSHSDLFNRTHHRRRCLTEPTTDYHYKFMSGNYQRQEGQFKNDHPIWTSPGWPNVREDMHIFLHDAGGQDDWYWAVTTDSTLAIDSRIKFRCAVGGAAALTPTACPKWNVTADAGVSYKYLPSLNLSDGLCPVSGQQLCVDSSQYHLAGLRGTFTLTIPHEPLWMRDLNQCDYKAGWVRYVDDGFYGKGYFMLYEPLNDWIIALCVIPRSESENGTFATAKWRPDLCNEWLSRNDQDLRYSAQHRSYDPTFNVSIGACSAQRAAVHGAPCVESDPPDAICLANNSIFQSSFMGTFERLNETGKTFDSPVYRRTAYDDGLNRNGSASFYIWYYIEAYAAIYGVTDRLSTRNWILSHYSLSEAISATTLYTYGRCEGWAYGNPMACQGWVFYGNGDLHYDEQMTTTEGECTANPVATIPDEWAQYICVGFVNASLPYADELSKVHKDQLIGAFVLTTSDVTERNPVPYWMKIRNDYNPSSFMKLWLGDGLWAISEYSPDKKSFMWCDSGNSANPIDCRTWYDYELEVLDNIYLYECTADDILSITTTQSLGNCSASHAFVNVKSQTMQTLTTAQALFPPYRYDPIPWTSLVIIPNDNICDTNSTLSTNIGDKIVLLFETTDCSAHYQVLAAQNNGARAVLMSNADLTGLVVNIPKDNDLSAFNVTIPMRSISLREAQVLKDEIIAGDDVQVQIGCSNTNYPTAICLTEPTTDYHYKFMSGNYQRQEGQFKNDHPIWTSPGWPNVREDMHIFLHDAGGQDDWYWAVTTDSTLAIDSRIKFRCAVGGAAALTPTACPKWNVTADAGVSYKYLPSLNLSDGLCPVSGQQLCVDSSHCLTEPTTDDDYKFMSGN